MACREGWLLNWGGSEFGHASVPPEQLLLKATVLMALYSVRSVRAFCERLNCDMLFKWFLDLQVDDAAMDASRSRRTQERLLQHEIADASSPRW